MQNINSLQLFSNDSIFFLNGLLNIKNLYLTRISLWKLRPIYLDKDRKITKN